MDFPRQAVGAIGEDANLICGLNKPVSLVEGHHCFSEVDLTEYFEEVKRNPALRIPDKFLKVKGWL